MLHQITNKIIYNPKKTLSLIGLITIFLLVGLSKISIESDFVIDLPKNDPMLISEAKVEENFSKSFNIWIGLKNDNVFQKSTLEQVESITESLKKLEWVIDDEVKSLTTINNIKGVVGGIEVGAYLKEIPKTESEFKALAQTLKADNLLNGQLVYEDGTFTLIAVNLEEVYNSKEIFAALQDLKAAQANPKNIYLAGTIIELEELDKGINADLNRLIPFALLLILLGYYFTFRTWRGVWLPFSMVLLSIIWTVGIQGWIGLPVNVVTSILPMLIIAVSSSYGIHLLHRYYEDITDHSAVEGTRLATANIGPALLMTGITSGLGTLTLLVFKVGMIREFGLLATIGMLVVVILSLTYMPAMLALLKKEESPNLDSTLQNSNWLKKVATFSLQYQFLILGSALFILIAAIYGISKIQVGDDLAKYFQEEHVVNQAFHAFNDHLNGTCYFDVMIDTGVEDGVKNPNFLQEIEAFQHYAESLPNVGKTNAFTDIIKRINQELHASNPDYLKIPATKAEISQYMLLYSLSGAPGDFSSLVDYDYQRTMVKVMIKSSKQEDHLALYEQLQAYKPQMMTAGFKLEYGGEIINRLAFIKYVVEGKILNMIVAVFLVLLFCSFVFRSLKIGLIAVVPLVFSTITTLGLMGILGIRLEMATAIITAIGVGIGIDFAIHFMMRFQREVARSNDLRVATFTTMQTAGRAISFDVLSNVLGFSVLLFSNLQPIQNFGGLVALMMVNVAVSTLLIMPAIILVFKPDLVGQQKSIKFKQAKASTVQV